MPAGLAFREGKEGTFFEDMNPYLVHVVKNHKPKILDFKYNSNQESIRKRLYDGKIFNENIYSKYNGGY